MSDTKTIRSTNGESAEAREAELLWRNRQLTAFQRISEGMLADARESLSMLPVDAREAIFGGTARTVYPALAA